LSAAVFQGFFVLVFGVFSFNLNLKITEGPPASDLNNLTVGCVENSVFFLVLGTIWKTPSLLG